jgi:hypothetical protein
MSTYCFNNIHEIKSDKYKTRLLGQVADSIDQALAAFVSVMPKIYFETNDEDTVLQHLSAIVMDLYPFR